MALRKRVTQIEREREKERDKKKEIEREVPYKVSVLLLSRSLGTHRTKCGTEGEQPVTFLHRAWRWTVPPHSQCSLAGRKR